MHVISLCLRRMVLVTGVLMALVQGAAAADGGIGLSRTRVIFQAGDSAQTLTLQNNGSRPYLVQSAVVTQPQGHEAAPFLATPPLFRLEANSKNTLRILRKDGASLPVDRESVFYFTAIAVPAMTLPETADEASLAARVSVGIRNTIKLFYRPAGLSLAPEEAQGRLTFHLTGGKVQVGNPTPYYLTFSHLKLDGTEIDVRTPGAMIAPFSSVSYPLTGHPRQAHWSVINDYGGNSAVYHATVQSGEAP